MTFPKNMGLADRIIRSAIGGGIIAAYATGKIKGPAGLGLLLLSGIFLTTSATASCPVYTAAHISSLSSDE